MAERTATTRPWRGYACVLPSGLIVKATLAGDKWTAWHKLGLCSGMVTARDIATARIALVEIREVPDDA